MENDIHAAFSSCYCSCFMKFFKKWSFGKDFVQCTVSAAALRLLLNLYENERWRQECKLSVLQTCLCIASRKIMQLTSLDLSLAGFFLGVPLQPKITSELSRSESPDTMVREHIFTDPMTWSNTAEECMVPRETKGTPSNEVGLPLILLIPGPIYSISQDFC